MKLSENSAWIQKKAASLLKNFASGSDVDVHKIAPRLEIAKGDSLQGDIFRLATLSWRIPVSEGYGRRLRFLVWDAHNDKLIGVIALGDAVFNLRARDQAIDWDHKQRAEGLVHMMDAYVLGAVPPYNTLLGGKLVASLVKSSEVVRAFEVKYKDSVGVISKKGKNPRLVAVTTSSALGRSSMYNRLSLGGEKIFQRIGYTSGYGHFHISDALYEDLRGFLARRNDPYADGFSYGQGPNWRIRVIRRALDLLEMNPDLIRHGMPREVFLCSLATNAKQFLRGEHTRVRYGSLRSASEVSELALERWVVPRAARRPDYAEWRRESFLEHVREFPLGQIVDTPLWTGQETS